LVQLIVTIASRRPHNQLVDWICGWELWTFSTRAGRTWMILGELAVLVWTILACGAALAQGPPSALSWTMFGLTAVVTAVHVAATRESEERRRVEHLSGEHIDHTGIWTVSGAIVLPAHLLVALVLAIRLQRYTVAHKRPFRVVFGTAGILGSALGAHAVTAMTPLRHWVTGEYPATASLEDRLMVVVWLVAAGSVYFLIQTVMFGAVRGMWLSWRWQDTIGSWKQNADFVATITFGLIAAVLKFTSPSLVSLIVVGAVLWTHNTRALNLVQYEARVDALTELFNRRGFDEQVKYVLTANADNPEFGISAAAFMLDLDHFKQVNDTHGHPNGDQVLRHFAGALRAHTRQRDLLCRKGGEEIMAFLPNTSLPEALDIAGRMRAAVAELKVPATRAKGGEPYIIDGLSVSIGVAMYPSHGVTIEELEKAADAAAYEAKQAGRNQVCLAALPEQPTTVPAPRPESNPGTVPDAHA
jgi:diguanylate cyclase (GGDEF)-like protein